MDCTDNGFDAREAASMVPTKPASSRPTLNLPPRSSANFLVKTSEATPSPMTLLSSFFAAQESDSDKSFSQLLADATSSLTPKCIESLSDAAATTMNAPPNVYPSGLVNKTSGGSAGIGRSSIARFKTMTPSRLPIPRSPYLTIPPGLSPTTLLDSPVLLSTGQAEPSPTTGTFSLPPLIRGTGSTCARSSDTYKDQNSDLDSSPTFVFKPFPELGKNPVSSLTNMGPFGISHQQVQTQVQKQAQAQVNLSTSASASMVEASTTATGLWVSSFDVAELLPPLQCRGPLETISEVRYEPLENAQHLQSLAYPAPVIERPSEDGYNWRKYGQKQVKGSEFPRSYYKCTHPNCSVKKKVERSHDGQVTEIVYKGEHNHPKPQATRRMSSGASHLSDGSRREGCLLMAPGKVEGSGMKGDGSTQTHTTDLKMQRSSTASDPSSSSMELQLAGINGTPELSCGSINDDVATDWSKGEGDDDEPDSKRRKKEKPKEEVTVTPLRTIREPRVVVQTTSDVDILDDGYRWRKYGQKVVKGNPYPRSYYKCTNVGCSVRKHVERSSTDPKAVITTYEGKHNHDVPAARNSSTNSNNYNAYDNINRAPATIPASSATTHIGFSGIAVGNASVSLQDQFLLGKLLEDRVKAAAGDRMTVGSNFGGETVSRPLASEQQSRGQGPELSVQVSMNLMNSSTIKNRPLEINDSFMQNLIPRPKEEQGVFFPRGSTLQPTFSSGSSFCQEMQQRLALGP